MKSKFIVHALQYYSYIILYNNNIIISKWTIVALQWLTEFAGLGMLAIPDNPCSFKDLYNDS